MLYAWLDGVKRAPIKKGERTRCTCGGELTSVIPTTNVKHWRHKGRDCDPWSEPEGPWHLGWKEHFDLNHREIEFKNEATGERHRADIFIPGFQKGTFLELQHSSISDDERVSREQFYGSRGRMFWLVHIHGESNFNDFNFRASLDFQSKPVNMDGNAFAIMRWVGRSNQFIEKWKRSTAYVFFDCNGHIFYLADQVLSKQLNGDATLKKGEFALCYLSAGDFIRAVHNS